MSVKIGDNGEVICRYETYEDSGDSAHIRIAASTLGLQSPYRQAMARRFEKLGLVWIRLRFGSRHYDVVPREWADSLISLDMADAVE